MKAHALKAAVAAALVALALSLRQRDVAAPATPQEALGRFLDAAKAGDIDACLALTTGPLRRSLESTRAQLGDRRFRRSLRLQAEGVKAHAIIPEPQDDPDVAVCALELVFADRNERQRVRLRRVGSGWAVEEMSESRTIKPPIPYGTPVFQAPPARAQRSSRGEANRRDAEKGEE